MSDPWQKSILHGYLTSNGAEMVEVDYLRQRKQEASEYDSVFNTLPVTMILPHDTGPEQCSKLKRENFGTPDDSIVTEWWVEKCVFSKMLVDKTSTLCQPLGNTHLPGQRLLPHESSINFAELWKASTSSRFVLHPSLVSISCTSRKPSSS